MAVVASILLMTVDHRQNHLETLRSYLTFVIYPIQYLAQLPLAAGRWTSEAVTSRTKLEEDNERLHQENLLLKVRLQQFEALEAENIRLRDLVGSSFKLGERVLIAELLSVDLDPYRQQVLIDKGARSGVFTGQPILDAHGVMGQVTQVNPVNSRVILITDAAHSLPVQVNRNGLRTIAVGTGLINRLELPQLPNNADIRVGDLLVTSGLGGRFPPGYPVAEVTEVNREPGRPFASVLATPSAHLERTREVLLVWRLAPRLPDQQEPPAEISDPPPSEESAP